jgi:hypothetical protein
MSGYEKSEDYGGRGKWKPDWRRVAILVGWIASLVALAVLGWR